MSKLITQNKKAIFNFEILEKLEAGLELKGFEVKAVKQGKVSLEGAHVTFKNGEAFIVGMKIGKYQPANTPRDWPEERPIRLLLKKREIVRLQAEKQKPGLTIVVTKLYTNQRGWIKAEIALVKGRKKHEKKELLKKRDIERQIRKKVAAQKYKI